MPIFNPGARLFFLFSGKTSISNLNINDNFFQSRQSRIRLQSDTSTVINQVFFERNNISTSELTEIIDIKINGKSDRAPIYITLGNAYYKKKNYSHILPC